jgi:RNA polymerase sigma-B factor
MAVAPSSAPSSTTLVEDHLPLAARIARTYRNRGVEDDDLLQVARLALVKAAERFDPDRGDFAPYAASTIRGEVKRYFRDHAWSVRPPRRLQDLQARIAVETSRGVRDPRRLADLLDVPLQEVREALAASSCFATDHLEEALGATARVDDGFEQVDAWLTMRSLRTCLSADDKQLLAWRFVDEMPQREIAALLGISQMQVSRRLSALLSRLRTEVGAAAA